MAGGLPLLRAQELLAASPTPKRGGSLRVAAATRGSSGPTEHLDPHVLPRTVLTVARTKQIFEGLFDFAPDGAPVNVLAADYSPNADGTVWRVKIKPGVEFHNGKTLTAADVVYSLQRVTNPNLATESKNDVYFLSPSGLRALDRTTVELTLNQPLGDIRDKMTSRGLGIVPDGATDMKTNPIGTGPFMYKSFVPGDRSIFVRNSNYRVTGKPYLDELQMFGIVDTQARLNGLAAGQFDAISNIDYTQISQLTQAGFKVLNAQTGGFLATFMNVQVPPFDDARVRLGIRLLHDRDQMVSVLFGQGNGIPGNDLPMRFDPLYASDIPQIKYDPEKAVALFKQAGLGARPTFELQTSQWAPGFIGSATLLKQEAEKVGVTINLKVVDPSAYYTPSYLAHPFTQTQWLQRSLDLFVLQALDSKAVYPETHWNRPTFDRLTRTARAALSPTKRKNLWHDAQELLWNQGGYAIWGLGNNVDAYTSKVTGFVASSVNNLGWYTFDSVSFV